MVSGLRVNFHKSVVGSVGITQFDKLVFSKCLNCRQIELPFKYLGMLIGGNPRRIEFWNPIIDKLSLDFLDRGVRCYPWRIIYVLLNLLLVLSLYFISPSKVLLLSATKSEESGKVTLVWGCEGTNIAWMKWKKVCSQVAVGRLRIKDIVALMMLY